MTEGVPDGAGEPQEGKPTPQGDATPAGRRGSSASTSSSSQKPARGGGQSQQPQGKEGKRRHSRGHHHRDHGKTTAYPESDRLPFVYLLPHYEADSEEAIYCRDMVMPRLVPALESLLTHVVVENQKAYYAARQSALSPPQPSDDRSESLAAELAYDKDAKWTSERYLPPAPLEVLSSNPLQWLAAELKRFANAKRREDRRAEHDKRRRQSATSVATTASSAAASYDPTEAASVASVAGSGVTPSVAQSAVA